jgi:predicted small secreted protein
MAWPFSRLTTYGAASPVKSVDLNAIQDEIIRLANGNIDSDRILNLTAANAAFGVNWAISIAGQPNPLFAVSSGGGAIIFGIPLREGDRLKSITFARFGDGIVDTTACYIYKTTAAGVGSDVSAGGITITNAAAAWVDSTVAVAAPAALAPGDSLALFIQANAANLKIGNVRCTYDHP